MIRLLQVLALAVAVLAPTAAFAAAAGASTADDCCCPVCCSGK